MKKPAKPDYSKAYTCAPAGKSCQACEPSEKGLAFCKPNGYKQEVACQWDGTVPKDYQQSHQLPEYLPCPHPTELLQHQFIRNQFLFMGIGLLALILFVVRRRRLL